MKLTDLRQTPFWHDQLGAMPALQERPPAKVDVLIVGAGYTGLSAALTTARGGRSTLVVDAEDPGYGCSSRNGGQISTSVKPSLEKLTAKFGPERARGIRAEGANALRWIGAFVASEGLDCD
ncbi:MAG: FAD-binding oxidoreductase, partial [Rhodobacteraceae bacterium]|nr:FAD-binding oxidoreductase [Paracoccaceae bacterium]